MTPRPDIVALPADATLEDLHAKVVETKLNKIPVYEKSLDDIFGVVLLAGPFANRGPGFVEAQSA